MQNIVSKLKRGTTFVINDEIRVVYLGHNLLAINTPNFMKVEVIKDEKLSSDDEEIAKGLQNN